MKYINLKRRQEQERDDFPIGFADWDDAQHILDTYGDNFSGDTSSEEMAATIAALDSLIESNGETLDEAINEWNMAVWGKTFASNSGPVPYSG